MTDDVRKFMHAVPFCPFVGRTSDGKHYRVKHSDYVAISPKGARITVHADEETGTMAGALHIVAVEALKGRTKAR